MRTVFCNNEITHVWANQQQATGKNPNRSIFFANNVIYSYGYHFPIAKHLDEKNILFTLRRYSNTTAKHISKVWQAARHKEFIMCANPDGSHSDNFNYWVNESNEILYKLRNAKKPLIYLNAISQIAERVNKYANFFKISVPADLALLLSIKDKKEYQEIKNKRFELQKKIEAKKRRDTIKRHKLELKKFYNFELSAIYCNNGKDYLRFNKETNNIESSQGVKIPFTAAKIMYNLIFNNKVSIGDKILNYEVISNDDKTVKIGCHNFDKKTLFEFGQKTF